jgi:signal transduction histidine kinase
MPVNTVAHARLIKNEVETAVSMLKAIHTKHRQGEMTLDGARKLGADLLRELRYGADGYFRAHTKEGVTRTEARPGNANSACTLSDASVLLRSTGKRVN